LRQQLGIGQSTSFRGIKTPPETRGFFFLSGRFYLYLPVFATQSRYHLALIPLGATRVVGCAPSSISPSSPVQIAWAPQIPATSTQRPRQTRIGPPQRVPAYPRRRRDHLKKNGRLCSKNSGTIFWELPGSSEQSWSREALSLKSVFPSGHPNISTNARRTKSEKKSRPGSPGPPSTAFFFFR